jgi:hypothetical protein
MKNLKKFKTILKAAKKGGYFKNYSNGIFELDSIDLDRYYLDVNDSVETIQADIKSYENDVKEYRISLKPTIWNWMNI